MFGGDAGLGDPPHRRADPVDGLADGTVIGAPMRAPPEAVEAIPTTDGGMNVWSPQPKTRLSRCTCLDVYCERNDHQHRFPKAPHERDKQCWAAATCTSKHGQVSRIRTIPAGSAVIAGLAFPCRRPQVHSIRRQADSPALAARRRRIDVCGESSSFGSVFRS